MKRKVFKTRELDKYHWLSQKLLSQISHMQGLPGLTPDQNNVLEDCYQKIHAIETIILIDLPHRGE